MPRLRRLFRADPQDHQPSNPMRCDAMRCDKSTRKSGRRQVRGRITRCRTIIIMCSLSSIGAPGTLLSVRDSSFATIEVANERVLISSCLGVRLFD